MEYKSVKHAYFRHQSALAHAEGDIILVGVAEMDANLGDVK
jgi:predicted HTH transcriptional regulator